MESSEFVAANEKLGVRAAFAPAAEFGYQIAREDAELALLMLVIALKKQP